ncbi:MAG: L-aspartate oxidase [Gemmatimonadaceae bacterium]|nr:L-aspartate oxidase [Gemmatimonadaceae bacterium]
MRLSSDYLVVGSGIAGLYFSILAARSGARVAMVTKQEAADSNTQWAQGGIAAALGPGDSPGTHVRDTLEAGAGLCDPGVVETVVREGPGRVEDLVALGVRFSRDDGLLSLGREGGHSAHRVVHADDWTGRELVRALLAAAEAEEGITTFAGHQALDLIVDGQGRCRGVWASPQDHPDGEVVAFTAPVTVLATGGAGRIYASTTNPAVATGDGIAMAWRAGAAVANLEFFQFHPTALAHPEGRTFLISEALRGYGAVVVNHEGEPFVERQLAGGSLATRDVVARAIVAEMRRSGRDCVYLDATARDPEETRRRFPNISRYCAGLGIDITRQPIPVAPAAHYLCGGVHTDVDGRTDLSGLYAVGEVGHTGFHGANRLASNSLLEAVVVSGRAVQAAEGDRHASKTPLPAYRAPPSGDGRPTCAGERLGRIMLEEVGITRTDAGLRRACDLLDELDREIPKGGLDPASESLRNRLDVARLVAHSARLRRESRGVHYNEDHPERDDGTWGRVSLRRRES